jgi:hypothetical protein
MAEVVYILCALTSLACAVLLIRGYRRSRSRLLLWSCLSFLALAANNVLLFVDLVIVPNVDLSLVRTGTGLCGMVILVYGLVWDAS